MSISTASLPLGDEVIASKNWDDTFGEPSRQRAESAHLAVRVESALRATGYPSLSAVRVTLRGLIVVLQGRVFSYYMKQVAQATALDVPGVGDLRNELVVVRPG